MQAVGCNGDCAAVPGCRGKDALAPHLFSSHKEAAGLQVAADLRGGAAQLGAGAPCPTDLGLRLRGLLGLAPVRLQSQTMPQGAKSSR